MTNNNEKKHKYAGKTEEARQRQLANLKPDAAIKHGGYQRSTKNFFTEEEQELFDAMFEEYREVYGLELPADLDLLERAITAYIKAKRQDKYEFESGRSISARAKDHAAQFLQFIQALGLDRRFAMSMSNKNNVNNIDLATLFMVKSEDDE